MDNWISNVDTTLFIVVIKTVYCERSNSTSCFRGGNGAVTTIEAVDNAGNWQTFCERVLLGNELDKEQNSIKLIFKKWIC